MEEQECVEMEWKKDITADVELNRVEPEIEKERVKRRNREEMDCDNMEYHNYQLDLQCDNPVIVDFDSRSSLEVRDLGEPVDESLDVLGEKDEEDEEEDESEASDFDRNDVDAMLEECISPEEKEKAQERRQARRNEPLVSSKNKYFLIECTNQLFEFLPPGWLKVIHESGMPVYCHRESRICTLSRPYGLGRATLRSHKIPVSAIPCLEYRKARMEEEAVKNQPEKSVDALHSQVVCDASNGSENQCQNDLFISDTEKSIPSSSSLSSTQDNQDKNQVDEAQSAANEINAPTTATARLVTADEHMQKSLLSAEEIRQYCTKLFQFRCKTVRRYHSWKVGRGRQRILKKWNQQKKDNDNAVKKEINRKDSKEKYQKNNGEGATSADRQSQAGLQQGPCTMLKNAKVVSITRPASGPDADGGKGPQITFILNPANKTPVSILHEFIQHTRKLQPSYHFLEMPDSNTPYQALVHIDGKEEGRGIGASKKTAKVAAAREAILKLAPELRSVIEGDEEDGDEDIFRDIAIDDSRVAEISYKAGIPAPYQILSSAMRRLHAQQPDQIKLESRRISHLKNEYIMSTGNHTVTITSQKRDVARHLCAQLILKQMHPELNFYGELLKLYGMEYQRQVQKKRDVQRTITDLQTRGKWGEPNWQLLEKLKQEMRKVIPVQQLATEEKSRIRYE